MKNTVFQMMIDIKTKSSPILNPHEIHFWHQQDKNHPKHLENLVPQAPFKFYTDAILGLSYYKMTDFKGLSPEQKHFAELAYRSYDPYTELFQKSHARVQSLRVNHHEQKIHCENLEKRITELWSEAFSTNVVKFSLLEPVLDALTEFENELSSPLIYNFGVHFSPAFTEKLLSFYSLLFHLRSIVAVDHNAHVEDSSYESVKCDSISDYLPKSDYTVNDALLYWNFKKLSTPFVGHKDKDPRIEKLFVDPMLKHFQLYSHNACHLVDNLPPSFMNSLSRPEQEEALHHVQMDWLLGSESGLLFKIREELYGVVFGYEKVFWHECNSHKPKKASHLHLCFELSEKDILTHNEAA